MQQSEPVWGKQCMKVVDWTAQCMAVWCSNNVKLSEDEWTLTLYTLLSWVKTLYTLLKGCAHPAHRTPCFFPRWLHHKWTFLGDVPTLTPPSARNQMKTRHEIRNWKCDKSWRWSWEMLVCGLWPAASAISHWSFVDKASFSGGMPWSRPTAATEGKCTWASTCTSTWRIKLWLGLGEFYLDLDLEDSTWTGKERPESGHEGVICLWSTTDIWTQVCCSLFGYKLMCAFGELNHCWLRISALDLCCW